MCYNILYRYFTYSFVKGAIIYEMSDWKNKFINFMAGRYGIDNFNRFIMWAIVVCIVAGWFGIRGFSKLALAFLIIYIYRMLSKNYNQRYKENQVYLRYTEKIRWHFSNLKKKIAYRKTHRIFKCPRCKKKLSVPKGKGKIEISCPCGNKFQKKT